MESKGFPINQFLPEAEDWKRKAGSAGKFHEGLAGREYPWVRGANGKKGPMSVGSWIGRCRNHFHFEHKYLGSMGQRNNGLNNAPCCCSASAWMGGREKRVSHG
jgi:hypothetical protein